VRPKINNAKGMGTILDAEFVERKQRFCGLEQQKPHQIFYEIVLEQSCKHSAE
jgi:hypothetical protein